MPLSHGDTFYVATSGSDAASGKIDAPWATIQHAFDVLQPGQVALVYAGSYGGLGARVHWDHSGTFDAPVTVMGVPGEARPVIRAEVRINGDYLRLSGVVLEGNGEWGAPTENGSQPIFMNTNGSASYFELSNSELFHSMKSGIAEYGDHVFILGNYIHDNGAFEDSSAYNLHHGIYLHPTANVVFANNIIEHNRAKGISGRYDGHLVWVLHNTIVGNDRAGFAITDSTHDFVIANNIFVNNGNVDGGTGIGTQGSLGGASIVEVHNITFHNGISGNDNWDPNASVDGNLVVDPLLVNPASSVPGSGHVAYSNDYHLLPGSPAVGYADPRYIVPTDHAGRCRAIAAAVGAYEP